MIRRWPALVLTFLFALLLTGPALAQDASTPAASPDAEDEPTIDLRDYGAWGVASRSYQQTETDLDYPIIFSVSLAAFPDADTAEEAFPDVRERMLDLPEYQGFDEVESDPIGDNHFLIAGQMESSGYTYNVALLVVQQDQYLTLAAAIAYETLDVTDAVVALAEINLDRADEAAPETVDDLLAALPEPADLPGADSIADPYEVTDETTREAE